MKRMLFLGVLLILAGRVRGQSATGVLVIRGGTLVDVRAGQEDLDGVIVIHGERIEPWGCCQASDCSVNWNCLSKRV